MLRLPLTQLIAGDRCGERAAGAEIGQQHGLVRAQDRRRLRHEVHAAEHDHLGVRFRGEAREPERVADVVGHVLHFGALVVVGDDDRVALLCERADLVLQRADLERGQSSTSRETWSERAACVSAPTEMKSTPVSA